MSKSIELRKQWQALNYKTYASAKENFNWKERWDIFDGKKNNFNIAHECIDRHPGSEIALRIKFDDRRTETYTFGELSRLTSQLANLLEEDGVKAGDRVAVLLLPSLEYYVSMFGIFKRGAVLVPCFPLFGPEAINYRLENSGANTIITTKDKKHLIDTKLVEKLNLKFIFTEELNEMLKEKEETYHTNTTSSDLSIIQYSSGTTGSPKAVKYTHGAITVAAVVVKLAGGLKPEDNYFCPSSPAWGHGIWYGTIAPLIFGKAVGTYSGKFDAEICLEALEEFEITNMAAISSHYRLMLGTGKVDKYKIKLRLITYSGEVMPKELIEQIKDTWGVIPLTQFGTTEVGPITLDFGGFEDWVPKPGSIGKPMIEGLKVKVVDADGKDLPPGQVGQIAIWQKERWERIGDNAYIDEDGYFWYVGRADDVIIASGYTIGPVEVEQTIMKHPAVKECAVVGVPDRERGEIVKAFIVLRENYIPADSLKGEIQEFVRDKLSKHEYPRQLEFIAELPKTPEGKIKRKMLKNRDEVK